MPDRASETWIAERFARWLSQVDGREYAVAPGADPPDFVLHPDGWLEVTDVYLRDEQARFLHVDSERTYEFSGPVDETAVRLAAQLDSKLGKQSYRSIHAERGKGILLLTCRDCFFDEHNVVHVREKMASFTPRDDKGFFRAAYFEYMLPGEERTYEIVYPRKA